MSRVDGAGEFRPEKAEQMTGAAGVASSAAGAASDRGMTRRTAFGVAFAGLAAACTTTTNQATQPTPAASAAAGPPEEVLGTGTVPIALLLPLASPLGQSFRNAAALAVADFPQGNIRILVKDDGGSDAGARNAVQQAIGQGAQLILGPIFSAAVSGAASVARPANVPIIGFSTDVSVAGPGVYLLSFLPQQDVERIVTYAGSQGKRSMSALLPDSAYGLVVEAALREIAGRSGIRLLSVERYAANRSDLAQKAQSIASFGSQIDSLFVPEGGDAAAAIGTALSQSGLSGGRVQLLGSGQWDDPRVSSNPAFNGGWYPAPDKAGFQAFASRYNARYGAAPPRTASLAYDGATLAAGLVRSAGPQPFSEAVLTNRDGFIGVDGLFRFEPNGQNRRGLAVYEISGGTVQIRVPAPRSFAAAS